ncbi:MAG: S8 family serine peptidase [Myxococcales bacterium]|nr:S8 family serine peptidase [Myxococcales bacterium]
MRRSLRLAVPVALAGLAALSCTEVDSPEPAASRSAALSETESAYYVVLAGPPAIARIPSSMDPRSPSADALVRARLAELETQHAVLTPAIEAHGARVIAELSRLANVIQVLGTERQLARIKPLPGVLRVERVPLMYPALASLIPVVGAPEVWAKSTPFTGDGITIGIIDTGIDYTHADFGGPGTVAAYAANNSTVIEPGSFPTTRVVGGWDFVGDDYNPSANVNTPAPDADPLDCTKPENTFVSGGHGSHVSGIAAGNGVTQAGAAYLGPYNISFNPVAYRVAPGVAPTAKLWALKVFGCDGSTTMLASALERAADPNQDGSFADRLDVVNASLGTSYALGSPTNGEIAANLTKAGTLIVAAAGNEGQTFFTAGAPGTIPEVLSVAASADNEFLALSVTTASSGAAKYAAAEGGFSTRLVDSGPVSGELVASQPSNGCSKFSNAAAVAGKMVLIDRGTCSFINKFTNALAAGAKAVVIVDDTDDALPFAMGGGDPGSIAIPGVMIRLVDGQVVKQLMASSTVTAGLDPTDKYTGVGAELLAGFSSRGPSAIDGRLKPEIAAPGFSVDSARVGSGTEPRRSQGTSQASPVVAGAAALVRQAMPSYSPLEVKAALINSTEPLVDLSGQRYPTSVVGSGRLAVERAVAQRITAGHDPGAGEVGVSFGPVVSDVPTTVERSVTLTNHDTAQATLDAKIEPTHELPGLVVKVEPTQVVMPAGQTATVKLVLTLDPVTLGSPGPDPGTAPIQSQQARQYLNEASGNVRFSHTSGGAEDVVVPYHGSVRAAAKRSAKFQPQCDGEAASKVEISLDGTSAHPNPVVTAFQLGILDDEHPDSASDPTAAMTDLRAIGAASDLATAASFDEARVFFAVAVSGTWTTPAHGALSVVTIEVDSDQDGSADFEIRAEARNNLQSFRDALTSATYAKGSEQRINRLPLNLVYVDGAETHPFNNSVVVFTALLSDLGLTAENPAFSYFGSTEDPVKLLEGEQTGWASFNPNQPLIDTTKYAKDGLPLFIGPGPIEVDVSAEARAGQQPLDLLLLHHTNVAGARYEVVSLNQKLPGNLTLTAVADASVIGGETTNMTFTVSNPGAEPAPDVKLSGTLANGSALSASPSQGSCAAGDKLSCDLGVLAAGATATVTLSATADADQPAVSVSADVASSLPCESSLGDNSAKASVTIGKVPTKPTVRLRPAGGCDCRVGAPTRSAPLGLLGLALLGLLFARRSVTRDTP